MTFDTSKHVTYHHPQYRWKVEAQLPVLYKLQKRIMISFWSDKGDKTKPKALTRFNFGLLIDDMSIQKVSIIYPDGREDVYAFRD